MRVWMVLHIADTQRSALMGDPAPAQSCCGERRAARLVHAAAVSQAPAVGAARKRDVIAAVSSRCGKADLLGAHRLTGNAAFLQKATNAFQLLV